jgi:hypothetical protein
MCPYVSGIRPPMTISKMRASQESISYDRAVGLTVGWHIRPKVKVGKAFRYLQVHYGPMAHVLIGISAFPK